MSTDTRERLLTLVRAEVGDLDLADTALVDALVGHVADAIDGLGPGTAAALSTEDAGRVALAVVEGLVAATEDGAIAAPGPQVGQLSTRELLRRALAPGDRAGRRG